LFGRVGWSAINGLPILSGAFSVFRRKAVVQTGGYRRDTVGEDMELILRLQRTMHKINREYRVIFIPDPVCWTQAPEDYRSLQTQRRRWQRGLSESLFGNFEMFLNPQFGTLGMISFPFFLFYEFLGPVIEFTGYIVFVYAIFSGLLNPPFALLFLSAAILLGILLSTAALLMEEIFYRNYPRLRDVLILFLFAVLENLFYRQLHTWWRFRGLLDFFFKPRTWGSVTRRSFNNKLPGSQ
jgi:cellulose synthase/poly-beta-1,6-N-acetylglucosamine synthase-like glycosyltransferase